MSDSDKMDTKYLHMNENGAKNHRESLPDHGNANGEQMPVVASSIIRSHGVSGDLHGIQPDPIAADILRKEPEHESFVRLNIAPIGINFGSCCLM